MAAVILDIADAVVGMLNAWNYGELDAERAYVPFHALEELDERRVTVVPAELTITALTRHADTHEYVIDIGIQQRIETNADADELMELVQTIADLFRGRRLDGYEAATCTAVANAPVFVPAHLDDAKVFTSVVRLTLNVPRSRS